MKKLKVFRISQLNKNILYQLCFCNKNLHVCNYRCVCDITDFCDDICLKESLNLYPSQLYISNGPLSHKFNEMNAYISHQFNFLVGLLGVGTNKKTSSCYLNFYQNYNLFDMNLVKLIFSYTYKFNHRCFVKNKKKKKLRNNKQQKLK
jgi:hypothetical protein